MTFMTVLFKIVVEKMYYLFGNATPKQPLNQERNWKKKLLACRTKKKSCLFYHEHAECAMRVTHSPACSLYV